jgi:outer membrane protein assembly factor BamB
MITSRELHVSALAVLFSLLGMLLADAAGVARSTYLGDSGRTGYVDAQVPASPALLWVYHERHPPRHAWPEPNREIQYIDFDYATQTAISDGKVFFGSSADHKVYAIDARTGEEAWTFYTEGPVRFAPVVRGDRVFVASDDGNLYCLAAATGKELWRFRGGPSDRRLIGNEQMISHWPARSGVLAAGGRLYFTAGMWSRDGVFIYCLDPEDGKVVWRNDTSGHHFATLPHSTGYAGVAPQGYLALNGGRLFVPTGRGAPAAFDAASGRFLWYENGLGYKPHQPGGSRVMAWKDWVIFKRRSQHREESVQYERRDPARGAASGLFAIAADTGKVAWSLTDRNIVAARDNALVLGGQGPVMKVLIGEVMGGYRKYWKNGKHLGHDPNISTSGVDYTISGPGKLIPNPAWMSPLPFKKWEADVGRVFVLLCAGDTVLAGGRGTVTAIDFDTGKIVWRHEIDGEARGISVVDGQFVVSTTSGKLYGFGAGDTGETRRISHLRAKLPADRGARKLAGEILKGSGIHAGYALMLGAGDGRLLYELTANSDLVVYCLEPDAAKVTRVRETLDGAGLLGVRAVVHHGPLDRLPYAPYFANLVVWGKPLGSSPDIVQAAELYRVTRPYGGVAWQIGDGQTRNATRPFLADGGVPFAEISESAHGVALTRGKLPGAGEWTHAHADVGRTGSSGDSLARLPLGMLWWGGPGPARIVSRHWRAPSPLFANGTLYVQGQHDVFAVDAYNGREIWNRHIENVGRFPPTHRGGNIVADDGSVYCVKDLTCLKLDAQTGKTLCEYRFALTDAHREKMATLMPGEARIVWEYLGLAGDCVLGTLGSEAPLSSKGLPHVKNIQQSPVVFAFDKRSGKQLWEHTLERSVSATAIVADGRAVYLLDRTGGARYALFRKPGAKGEAVSVLKALALASGNVLWTREGLSPAWKALMLSKGQIVAYPNPAEVLSFDGDKGVGVHSARDGSPAWSLDKLPGVSETGRGGTMRHSFIVDDTLFLPWAFDLRTGKERLLETDPLTGKPERFSVSGKNFCGTFSAAKDLLIYRSASIGFAEINRDSGSYWLPESRPSCWISAIPAGGMVLAPEGYSTCICPYNYKTSLAMIPVERNENWSVYLAGGRREKKSGAAKARKKSRKKKGTDQPPPSPETIRSLRVNLNAPGDQMDANGKLWLAWPRPVDPKRVYIIKQVPLSVEAVGPGFRFNSDHHEIAGADTPWLYTSGLTGPLKLTVQLSDGEPALYDVSLRFAETEHSTAGQRLFDVVIQGEKAISGLDAVAAAGGMNRALVKECRGVKAEGTMTIELVPVKGDMPLLCAFEILER